MARLDSASEPVECISITRCIIFQSLVIIERIIIKICLPKGTCSEKFNHLKNLNLIKHPKPIAQIQHPSVKCISIIRCTSHERLVKIRKVINKIQPSKDTNFKNVELEDLITRATNRSSLAASCCKTIVNMKINMISYSAKIENMYDMSQPLIKEGSDPNPVISLY